MEQLNPQPQVPNQAQNMPPSGSRKNLPLTTVLILLFLIMSGGLVFLGYENYRLKAKVKELEAGKAADAISAPPEAKKPDSRFFTLVQEREGIASQKNINPGQTVSSGFLDPNLISESNESSFLNKKFTVNAQEKKEAPFLFYIRDKIKIRALNLETGVETEFFDLRDFPEITINAYTAIQKQYFINKNKIIVFHLQQDLGGDTYESGIYSYNLITQKLTKVATVKGGPSAASDWHGFKLSPDENYLFVYYTNNQEQDPFWEVPVPTNVNINSFDNTFMFYNTVTGELRKYKTNQFSPGGIPTEEWDEGSNFVTVNYDGNNEEIFFDVYPSGKFVSHLVISNQGRWIRKMLILNEMKKIFYIASGSNKDELTFAQNFFGYYDLEKNTYNDVSDGTWESQRFIFDYKKNVIFDKIVYERGVVKDYSLNSYNLETGEVKEIISGRFYIIGFNGDENHLLLGNVQQQETLIYEIDLTDNTLLLLAKALAPIYPQ